MWVFVFVWEARNKCTRREFEKRSMSGWRSAGLEEFLGAGADEDIFMLPSNDAKVGDNPLELAAVDGDYLVLENGDFIGHGEYIYLLIHKLF